MKKIKHILGIETSCDETAVTLLKVDKGVHVTFLKQLVYSQIKEHEKFGGVVPEIAARKHLEILPLMIEKVRDSSGFDFTKLDAIAVTYGPGLVTSLMVGVDVAKTLGMIYNVPLVPVNHLEGHILSVELPAKSKGNISEIVFPALALVVSGGHTELVTVKSHTHFERVGQTLDDAAGEAFDKVAKLLGLGYPGGPLIEKFSKDGNPLAYDFPRPMAKHETLDFSYSGLKTAVRITLNNPDARSGSRLNVGKKINNKIVSNISASFQAAVVESLMIKLEKAIDIHNPKTIIFGGGVANNSAIRNAFLKVGKLKNIKALMCSKKYAGDNASMIAFSGFYNLDKTVRVKKFYTIKADPQLTYK